MGDLGPLEPLSLKMGVSIVQVILLSVLILMSALRPVEEIPPLPTPVNGNWSKWISNSTCSVTCGGGFLIEIRNCSNPEPSNGGKSCPGSSSRVSQCNTQPCPINGQWSVWLLNTTCSVTCGGGFKTRYRVCDSPAPAFGGNNCTELDYEILDCSMERCPVHGKWSSWSDDVSCTVSCGGGFKVQLRTCDNPTREKFGDLCTGNSSQTIICNTNPCPINGNWGNWQDDKPCSVSCNSGTLTQKRLCDNPPAQFGGLPCAGSATKTLPCNTFKCPIDGNWGAWTDQGQCSATCGSGGKAQIRTCSNPAPANCGKICPGSSLQIVACTVSAPCPACKTDAYTKDNGANVCGFFIQNGLNYHQAKAGCEFYGAKLPETRSVAEHNVINAKRPPGTDMWIGLNDIDVEGTFVWASDGKPTTFKNWGPGQPDNWFNEDCAYITSQNYWNDYSCDNTMVTYCELFMP